MPDEDGRREEDVYNVRESLLDMIDEGRTINDEIELPGDSLYRGDDQVLAHTIGPFIIYETEAVIRISGGYENLPALKSINNAKYDA